MYFCTIILNNRVVSSDVHTEQRPLAAGFKAYYPTERTEHATIAWSDYIICAIQVQIIIITAVMKQQSGTLDVLCYIYHQRSKKQIQNNLRQSMACPLQSRRHTDMNELLRNLTGLKACAHCSPTDHVGHILLPHTRKGNGRTNTHTHAIKRKQYPFRQCIRRG